MPLWLSPVERRHDVGQPDPLQNGPPHGQRATGDLLKCNEVGLALRQRRRLLGEPRDSARHVPSHDAHAVDRGGGHGPAGEGEGDG
jgi:hypothetical protein